jgi:hypothetical protein
MSAFRDCSCRHVYAGTDHVGYHLNPTCRVHGELNTTCRCPCHVSTPDAYDYDHVCVAP